MNSIKDVIMYCKKNNIRSLEIHPNFIIDPKTEYEINLLPENMRKLNSEVSNIMTGQSVISVSGLRIAKYADTYVLMN